VIVIVLGASFVIFVSMVLGGGSELGFKVGLCNLRLNSPTRAAVVTGSVVRLVNITSFLKAKIL
jgi:hypothetical protein